MAKMENLGNAKSATNTKTPAVKATWTAPGYRKAQHSGLAEEAGDQTRIVTTKRGGLADPGTKAKVVPPPTGK